MPPNQQQLRDFEAWSRSLQNFQWLKEAVPGASDIDTIVNASTPAIEHFLVFEYKAPGTPVSTGQRILLEGLASDKPKEFTVVTAHGPDQDGVYFLSGSWQGKVDKECLAKMAGQWWKDAKKGRGKAA